MELVETQTQRSRLVGVSGVWSLLQGCLRLDRFQRLLQYSQVLSWPLVMCVRALFKHRLGTGMYAPKLFSCCLPRIFMVKHVPHVSESLNSS